MAGFVCVCYGTAAKTPTRALNGVCRLSRACAVFCSYPAAPCHVFRAHPFPLNPLACCAADPSPPPFLPSLYPRPSAR